MMSRTGLGCGGGALWTIGQEDERAGGGWVGYTRWRETEAPLRACGHGCEGKLRFSIQHVKESRMINASWLSFARAPSTWPGGGGLWATLPVRLLPGANSCCQVGARRAPSLLPLLAGGRARPLTWRCDRDPADPGPGRGWEGEIAGAPCPPRAQASAWAAVVGRVLPAGLVSKQLC